MFCHHRWVSRTHQSLPERAFMALFGRGSLPHRSTISRFVAAIDQPSVEVLRTLFVENLLARPSTSEKPGGLWNRQAAYWLVFDVYGTRSVARQRALSKTSDLPNITQPPDTFFGAYWIFLLTKISIHSNLPTGR